MNNYKNNRCRSKESGMSLIELMISMVIGVFLLAGVVTNFIGIQSSDKRRDAVSEMDANASAAFKILRQAVSHAGYRSIENVQLESDMAFYTATEKENSPSCNGSIVRDAYEIKPSESRTRDGSTKDFLTVISLADNPCLSGEKNTCIKNPAALVYMDCSGGGSDFDERSVACSTDINRGMKDRGKALIYNSFSLIRNTSSNEDRTLYCIGNRGGKQPIVSDVETIQYLYGVRDGEGNVTFRKADQVTTANQWAMVVSVQVGLLMRSSNQFILDEPNTKSKYNILNQNVSIADEDLQRLFRVYTTTINIENRQTNSL